MCCAKPVRAWLGLTWSNYKVGTFINILTYWQPTLYHAEVWPHMQHITEHTWRHGVSLLPSSLLPSPVSCLLSPVSCLLTNWHFKRRPGWVLYNWVKCRGFEGRSAITDLLLWPLRWDNVALEYSWCHHQITTVWLVTLVEHHKVIQGRWQESDGGTGCGGEEAVNQCRFAGKMCPNVLTD